MVQGPFHSDGDDSFDDFDDDAQLSKTEHPSLTRAAASSSRNPQLKAAAPAEDGSSRSTGKRRPRHPVPKRGGSGPFSGSLTAGGQRPAAVRSNKPAPIRTNEEDWNTFDMAALPIFAGKDENDYTKLILQWYAYA